MIPYKENAPIWIVSGGIQPKLFAFENIFLSFIIFYWWNGHNYEKCQWWSLSMVGKFGVNFVVFCNFMS